MHQYGAVYSSTVICSCAFMNNNISRQSLCLHLFVQCMCCNFSLVVACKMLYIFLNSWFLLLTGLFPDMHFLAMVSIKLLLQVGGSSLKLILEITHGGLRPAGLHCALLAGTSKTSLELKLCRIQKNKKGKFISFFCFCILWWLFYG